MRLRILTAVAVVIVSGTAYLLLGKTEAPKTSAPGPDLHFVKASKGSITKTLRLAGQTSAREFVNITAPKTSGPESDKPLILLKLVSAGAPVKKGQLIASIDAQATADHVDDVADFVKQADADVRKRKAEQEVEWETLQQTLRQAKSDMDKAKLDAKTSVLLTDIERELLELNAEETAARYKQLQQSMALYKSGYDAEIRILELTRERQKRHHDRHASDLTKFEIHAPMNGLAVMQQIWRGGDMSQVKEGDQVYPGLLFLKVVNPASMQLEAKANQVESSELRVGQKVKIHLDAFPGSEFDGHIYSIGALATGGWIQNTYIRNIPVNIKIDGADPRLIPDLSAAGDVSIDEAHDVVTVPLGSVRESHGRASVMVRQGDAVQERSVVLGLRNGEQVAVVSGLQAGEEVKVN